MKTVPVLLVLLAGSGCAALIYEVVWFQLLQLVIGSSAVSLGLLLAAYMTGLCVGSAALPRVVSRRVHPLKVYAALELGLASSASCYYLPFHLSGAYVRRYAGCLGFVARDGRRRLPVASDAADGASLPALPVARAAPRGVAWVVAVQRQYRRPVPAACSPILSIESPRHGRGHLRRGWHQCPCCPGHVALLARIVRHSVEGAVSPWRAGKRRSFTSPSRSPLSRWARKSLTRLLSLLLGERCIRSPSFSRCSDRSVGAAALIISARRVSAPAMALTFAASSRGRDRLDGAHSASSLPYWPVTHGWR